MELRLNSNNMEDVQGITIECPYVLHRDEYLMVYVLFNDVMRLI